MKLPLVGLGTWELRGKECTETVRLALEVGYRHIDTAHMYENHAAIRPGITGFDRGQLFLTSKLTVNQIDPSQVAKSVEKACDLALKELGTDYIDLYLIHWPDEKFPMVEIYQAMETLVEKKKVRKAGVSNYTIQQLQELFNAGFKPKANQVEFHPYFYQKELLDYCLSHKMDLISFRSLGKGALLKSEPLFAKIGAHHGKTGAQVILRWLVQKGIPVIPKSSTEKHLKDNLDVLHFSLSEAEMKQIDGLHKNQQFCEW
jgi:diketogulonate reductase-like aldo/keto reductase